MRLILCAIVAFSLQFGTLGFSYAASASDEAIDPATARLEDFLRLGRKKNNSTRYVAATVPGTDVILVYLTGDADCTLRSCRLLILRPCGDTFNVIGRPSSIKSPIAVLTTAHNGLPDIGVRLPQDGDSMPSQVALPFNGYFYPGYVDYAPATVVGPRDGEILISRSDKGTRLFR